MEQRIDAHTVEILKQGKYYEALVKNSPIAIVSLNLSRNIESANPAFEKLFGYHQYEVMGKELDSLITTDKTWDEARNYTIEVLNGEKIFGSGQRRRKDGSLVDVEIFGVPVMVEGEQVGMMGLYSDISERKKAERQLQHMATHDPLTNLPNRSLFYDRLNHALHLAKRQEKRVAVLFLDLDDFKSVNDSFGHAKGDQLLHLVADRLNRSLRESDSVGRLGGDEFAFVFENILKTEDAAEAAVRLLTALSVPFSIDEHEFSITASIGISLSPDDGEGAEDLVKYADEAMYRSKELGRNTYQFYFDDYDL